ncbi:hypothetical protein EMPS_07616 [Entomortierella parvispora]|uniref:Ndc10 domain-containing protein n=1 Tax=Entomortierella parvispora TaxID=205924 RepID=A0A9P3HF91_9FUNG|nr:hypothetical protein EMPS_07616 [Entomortierella parvispora]
MQLVREQRRESIKMSTRALYDRYQAVFSKWCTEAGYSDANVIKEKVLRYWTCLTASKEDPSKGIIILPIGMRGKRKGIEDERERGDDNSDSDSDSDGHDSEDTDDDSDSDSDSVNDDLGENVCHSDRGLPANAPSLSTVKLHASAIGELCRQQRVDPDNKVMFRCLERKPMDYPRDLITSYERRVAVTKRATDTDQGSANFVEEDPLENVKMVMVHFWHHNIQGEQSKWTRVITGLRHRADAALRFFMMCRSETTRRMRLIDLFGQNVASAVRKDQEQERKFVLGVVLMTRQGKMNNNGKIRYNVVVRDTDVEACPVGALAFYLLEYWLPTSSSAAPPPRVEDHDWVNYHLLSKSTTRTSEIRYATQYKQTREVQDYLNIGVKGKATHLSRRLGAFLARLTGATHEDISKHGGWGTNRLITHYLDGVDASVALQMAGFENGRTENFWLERNVIPDLELQRMVFPFIERACSNPEDKKHYDPFWIQTIDNIMLDRSIFYGRQEENIKIKKIKKRAARKVLSDEAISRRRHLCLLAHLRKVILQDAAVFLLAENKSFNKN